MITDDPGTPGNGKWEINLPIAFEHRPEEWTMDAPGIDLNYGLGDHIQLTLADCARALEEERSRVDRRARWHGGGGEMAFRR